METFILVPITLLLSPPPNETMIYMIENFSLSSKL